MAKKAVCLLMLMMILLGTSPPVFAAKFSLGDTVEVYNTGASGLLVRNAPAGSSIIGKKYDGDRGTVTAGPQSASLGGVVYTWWKVRWADALEGWSAEDWLMKIMPPDLTVEDIWVLPSPFYPSDTVTIYTRIRNLGPTAAVSGQGLWISALFDWTPCYQDAVEGLGSGYAYTFQWSYVWPSNTNSHTIQVTVDPNNYIVESNEGNNVLPRPFSANSPPVNHPPFSPSNPSPFNHASSVSISTVLSWSGGDPDAGDTVTYDVYFGVSSSPQLVSSGQSASTYNPGTLSYSKTYYWKIVARDNHGLSTTGSVWDFTTQSAPVEYRTLTVYSSPSGVVFTADGSAHSTSWSATYAKGTSVSLVMPSPYSNGDARYYWDRWSDGVTSSSRTITLNSDTTLTGSYIGPYYELAIASSPTSGIPFILWYGVTNEGTKTTIYNEWLYQGYYNVEMPATYSGYAWQRWMEDGNTNRMRTVLLTQSTTLTAVYLGPDFSISALPSSLTIQQGSSDSSTITVTSLNGFDQLVSLQVDSRFLPPGVTASLSFQSVKPPADGSATSTLTVSVSTEAGLDEHCLMAVTGTYGALEHPYPIQLKIVARPPSQVVFNPPYEASSLGAGWHEYFMAGRADHDSTADRSVGNGKIVVRAWTVFGGDGKAFAKVTFEDSWINEWSGETRAKATINVNGLITWSAASFASYLLVDAGGGGVLFDACLRVYDYSTATEIWRKDLPIYHYATPPDLELLGSCGGDAKGFRDSQYVVQGLLDLETGHTYIWTFEAQLYAWSWSIEMGGGNYGGNLKIDLVEVRIDREELATEPVPNVSSERFLDIMIGSPADLLFVDAQGRHVGFDFATQQEVNEIPEAFYSGQGTSPQLIEIPFPVTGDCHVFVCGTNVGFYHLYTLLGNLTEENPTDLEFSAFLSLDIPISASTIHQYTIDWAAISEGEKGVIVEVDSEGNGGVPEYTFTSDSELTQNEFLIQTGQSALYTFSILWGAETFIVSAESNSTVSDFAFSQPDKKIGFGFTGSADTIGFCNVTVPKALLYGEPWTVLIDGASVPATITENATHTSLYFTYAHSTHEVQIIGTWAIGPLPTYSLTITTTAGGTADPLPGTYSYTASSSVQVTAMPSEGYSFDHWELDTINVGSANPYTVMMDGNHTLKAVFVFSNPQYVVGDINKDGIVDVFDLVLVVIAFGGGDTRCDLNGDGAIDIFDLATVAMNFGRESTPP